MSGRRKDNKIRPSKAQIDKLGERLRAGDPTDADLRLLDAYRKSFGGAYKSVVEVIVTHLNLQPTGRPAKSTTAIAHKLQREHIRLTQMQDIAGCRIVVDHTTAQDIAAGKLLAHVPSATLVDRRKAPSHGYRAVHVIVRVEDKPIEVQIRTELQHLWAELSEKFADKLDPAIKYGRGDDDIRRLLAETSLLVSSLESLETGAHPVSLSQLYTGDAWELFAKRRQQFADLSAPLRESFSKLIAELEDTDGEKR